MIAAAYAQAIEQKVDTIIAEEAAHELPFWQEPEVWLTVAFLIFIGALAKPAWKRITGGLDARAAQIETELDEARRLREEAQAALAAYQRKQRDAAKEAEAILAHAEEEAKRITASAEKTLADTLRRREQMTAERIALAQSRAVDEVKAEAVEVALAATRRLLEENLDDARRDALVDQAVKELSGKLQ